MKWNEVEKTDRRFPKMDLNFRGRPLTCYRRACGRMEDNKTIVKIHGCAGQR